MWTDVERTNNTSKEGKVPYTKFEAGATTIRILDINTLLHSLDSIYCRLKNKRVYFSSTNCINIKHLNFFYIC